MIGEDGPAGFPAEKGQRGDVGPPGLSGKFVNIATCPYKNVTTI